jgi:cellulose synthase/poly-beta-1,6-N-acetylglucosamine synthase-like glycosyltransferase
MEHSNFLNRALSSKGFFSTKDYGMNTPKTAKNLYFRTAFDRKIVVFFVRLFMIVDSFLDWLIQPLVVWWFVVGAVAVHVVRTAMFVLGAALERRTVQHLRHSVGRQLPTPLSGSEALLPTVSVVVPARNEEGTIERCVRSLMATMYPANRFEVIVVNDRSTDGTGEVLQRLQGEFAALRVHNTIETHDNTNLQGKTRALHQGIEHSDGDVVMMTDADCVVQPTWVRHVAELFVHPDVALVPSFTVIQAHTVFARMQGLEWVFNHTMASAGIGLGQPLGCFGNNLSVRRSVYDAFGGYARIPFSVTEDLAMLQAVARLPNQQIRYVCDEQTRVETLPCPTLSAFVKQHRRWVLGGRALGWRATVFVALASAVWAGLLVASLAQAWWLVATILLVRMLCDVMVVLPSLYRLNMVGLVWWFPFALPFFLLVELITPFFLLKPSVEWKGQILRG